MIYKKPAWAIQQIIRIDKGGLVEDICDHGVGHPNKVWLNLKSKHYTDSIHGCCGCCAEEAKNESHQTLS